MMPRNDPEKHLCVLYRIGERRKAFGWIKNFSRCCGGIVMQTRIESAMLWMLFSCLIVACIAIALITISELPAPARHRELSSLACFAVAHPAPGSEAPVSAPPYPPPGRASMAARVHPIKEMAP
jgi:hypothetical protein